MIYGLDTSFLVASEIDEHPQHSMVQAAIARLLVNGDRMALAPQVLAEFVHIVTDQRRFANPLTLSVAHDVALKWWTARDTVHVFPDERATLCYLALVQGFSLGRKRLLDTLLAATYDSAGVASLLTINVRDFTLYGCFQWIGPAPP